VSFGGPIYYKLISWPFLNLDFENGVLRLLDKIKYWALVVWAFTSLLIFISLSKSFGNGYLGKKLAKN
jgi:hypothetical protein